MHIIAKITSKGQTTLPAEVRAALGVGPGDRVEFIKQPDGTYEIRKVDRDLASLRGIVQAKRPVDYDEMDRLIAERRGRG
jgi:antitoxin PrlF